MPLNPDELRSIEATLKGGTLGVAAIYSGTGEIVTYNAETIFPTASVIKAPIVAELYTQAIEGKLLTSAPVTVNENDFVGGSGILAHLVAGHTFTLDELALLAIKESDNTASNLILRAVGGPEAVNYRMHTEWNMPDTVIHRTIQFHLAADAPPHTATGTPQDMMTFMNTVASGTLHSPVVCDYLLELLATPDGSSLLSRYLDVNPYADDLDTQPPSVTVLHKPGGVNGVRNNAGIIRSTSSLDYFALCVYTKDVPDRRWTAANIGSEAVSLVGELLVDYFFAP